MTIVIPDEKPTSWNKYYAGKHWSDRNNETKRVHLLVRSYIDPYWPIFDALVDITVTTYFKNNSVRLDASNITAKLYEDGLIGHLIKDDSWRQVRSMKTVTLLDRKDPRVEITITEAIAQLPDQKKYKCPGCGEIWTAHDLFFSEGGCLTEPDKCDWEDELEPIEEKTCVSE